MDAIIQFRHHIDRRKAGLPFACRIKWRNTNQTVHTFLGFQISIRMQPIYLKCHGFDTRFLTIQIVENFYRETFLLRKPRIHTI
jgi:hypothetical protein